MQKGYKCLKNDFLKSFIMPVAQIEKLTLSDVIKIEYDINKGNFLTLLLCTINGVTVKAIFTSYENAVIYMNRECISDTLSCYLDSDESQSPNEFKQTVINNKNFYELICVSHINPREPIYMLQSRNFNVFGDPTKYLTNSLDVFREYCTDASEKWIQMCTVKLDPELPPLNPMKD